jgi:hypothetical protein
MQVFSLCIYSGFPISNVVVQTTNIFFLLFFTLLEERRKTKVCGPGLGRAADDDTAAAAPSVTHFHDSP